MNAFAQQLKTRIDSRSFQQLLKADRAHDYDHMKTLEEDLGGAGFSFEFPCGTEKDDCVNVKICWHVMTDSGYYDGYITWVTQISSIGGFVDFYVLRSNANDYADREDVQATGAWEYAIDTLSEIGNLR